ARPDRLRARAAREPAGAVPGDAGPHRARSARRSALHRGAGRPRGGTGDDPQGDHRGGAIMTTPTRQDLLAVIDWMSGVRVLVVADLAADEFEYGQIARVSREAPVLILEHVRTDRLPGGGANAVNNLCALGGRPVVVGRVGPDEAGETLVG